MPINSPLRWWHAPSKRLASTAVGACFFSHTLHYVDHWVIELTHGQHSLTNFLSGVPILTLTTVGAKSGQRRSVPLVGIPDGDKIVLFASNWGRTFYPAWYHNLRANPEAQITWDGQTRTYVAREASVAERARYWQQAGLLFPVAVNVSPFCSPIAITVWPAGTEARSVVPSL